VNTERKLVTIREVSDLQPIPGADAIEVATVDGWKCVVKKNIFSVGDWALYFEIDSILPIGKPQFDFLTKGVKSHRLKTIRLRKQLSQGLLLPIDDFPELQTKVSKLGQDVTALLGVTKYDPDPPPQIRNNPQYKGIRGFFRWIRDRLFRKRKPLFPSFIRKTDQARIQNCAKEVCGSRLFKTHYEVTEKLDGSSLTLFNRKGVTGVCSRNLQLDPKKDPTNPMVQMYEKYLALLKSMTNYAIQGEIIGPTIQGNKYKLDEYRFYVFDIFDIEKQRYLTPLERMKLIAPFSPFEGVPVIAYGVRANSLETMLKEADGESKITAGVAREGFVYKAIDEDYSFKVISNAWLEAHE
jgi:hypothetical protein